MRQRARARSGPARPAVHPPLKVPSRLSRRALAEHLRTESQAAARIVRELRRTILTAVPDAAEAIKFRVLCYYHHDAYFGALGGNICMIEVKDIRELPGDSRPVRGTKTREPRRRVFLSFIHGAALADPSGLLRGRLKNKRFVPILTAAAAASPAIRGLLKASRDLRPWDEGP